MKNNKVKGTIDPKDLEGGNLLRSLVTRFNNKPCEESFIPVLLCLRDSFVVIPGDLKMSDTDLKAFLNAKIGDTLTSQNQMKFVPEILRNGDEFFLPVFSSADQMGEHEKKFSKMKWHFFEAMRCALDNKKVCGIVLDAFTQSFIVRKEVFDFIGELPSLLKYDDDNLK